MDETKKGDEELVAQEPPSPEASAPVDEQTDEELAAAAGVDEQLAEAEAQRVTPPIVSELEEVGALIDSELLAGRPVAGKPSTIHLEDAMAHWDLEPAEVLGWGGTAEEELVITTAGGKKLRWPDDDQVKLTDSQRGRTAPPANRVFSGGYVRRDASKDPQD